MVRIRDADGVEGVGYSYTIGTGGSSVMKLLDDHLVPLLVGREGGRHRNDLARPVLSGPCDDGRCIDLRRSCLDRHGVMGSARQAGKIATS